MKKLFMAGLCLTVCGFANAGMMSNWKWQHLFDIGDTSFSIDEPVKNKDGTISVLFKIYPNSRQDTEYRVTRYTIDCKTREARGRTINFDKATDDAVAGDPLQYMHEGQWNRVMPQTATYKLMQHVCSMDNQTTKQRKK